MTDSPDSPATTTPAVPPVAPTELRPDAPRPDGALDTTTSRPDGEVATDPIGGISSAPALAEAVAAGPSAVTAAPFAPRAGTVLFGATFGSDTSGFGGLVKPVAVPVSAPRPYGGWFDEAVDALEAAYPGFADDVTRVVIDRGELTLHVRPQRVAAVLQVLRDSPDHRFELLSNLSGVDYPAEQTRLHVVYNLTSMTYRRRLRIETAVTVEDPHVVTATKVYPTADFQEREAWDFFGVIFDGHPGLTRIMMPDDWEGHPQRKDYPL
ncbi:MAG: NADH-quinone oxidoreductase subunit, partial [Frankiales bacterium]|nr:NADH-quinone oxidoreductase subunit [Frankiales bacterium]